LLQGWIVTYIIDVRGGGPSSGYVSAGFFGGTIVFCQLYRDLTGNEGLMTGRIALLWLNQKASHSFLARYISNTIF
jgi:hypothetical protein